MKSLTIHFSDEVFSRVSQNLMAVTLTGHASPSDSVCAMIVRAIKDGKDEFTFQTPEERKNEKK